MRTVIAILFLLAGGATIAQVAGTNDIRRGNKLYHEGKMEQAEEAYNKSLEKGNTSFEGTFNRADALYKQEKYEDCAKIFKQLAESAEDKGLKSKAYHNLGNAMMKTEQYQPAAEAYKNALRNNPADEDTRHNLSMALKKIKEQEQQQQQQQQEQKQDQQQQQQKQEQQEKKEKEQEQQEQQQQQQEQQQQQKENQLSKEEAQRMLDALNNEEKKLQEKIKAKMTKPNQKQIEKDW